MTSRRTYSWVSGVLALCGALLSTAPLRAEALLFHAVSPGQKALDAGEGGGNPFASALIEALARPTLTLGDLPGALKSLTLEKSRGRMTADVPSTVTSAHWALSPPKDEEQRVALVLVVSDYSRSGGAKSLAGAKHDAERISTALTDAGFAINLALDLDRGEMEETLAEFRAISRDADVALVYTTGHGVEVDGRTYLIPSDYPVKERNAALASRAMPLATIAAAPEARSVNLVFYGGCRDNPFGAK